MPTPRYLYTAIARHTVLVMAALAACVVTAAHLADGTNTQARHRAHQTSHHHPSPD